MKLTKKQKTERIKRAKEKAHWKSFNEGKNENLKFCKRENQDNYEKFLSLLDDLNASKRIYQAIENKEEVRKLTFSIELLDSAIKDIFEKGYSSIRPEKRNDRTQKYVPFTTSGTTSIML